MPDWGRGTYGQGGGLGALDSVISDMQQSKRQREAMSAAERQREADRRAILEAEYLRAPDARKREILAAMGIQMPAFQPDAREEAELQAAIARAKGQKGLAEVPLDPFQQQMGALAYLTDKVPNKETTEISGARAYMKPETFGAFAGEGFTPANVVEKNKAAAYKDTTEGQFNQGPRTRVADANVRQSDASAVESGKRLGLIKEQTTNEAAKRDPRSPVSPGFVKAQPANANAPKPDDFAREAVLAIDDLLNSPGFSAAVGAKNVLVTNPVTGKPYGGTNAAEIEPKYARIRSLMTLPNLGIMKGVLSDSDIRMLQSLGLADVMNMKEETARKLLTEARAKLAGKAGVAQPSGSAVIRYDARGKRVQ